MDSKDCCVIITTTDKEEIAELISAILTQSKLAACVQVDKVVSFFIYDEKTCKENEFRLMIKAKSSNYKNIEESIKLNHNYQIPEIIKLDITDGLNEYINWIHSK
ncbi:MAG: divalent-cation tolerance protein CutA [Rickettsiales bacterium]|nr:MAG: divalent-cation tolerance protein CutA [Rickettsiales bacterium]